VSLLIAFEIDYALDFGLMNKTRWSYLIHFFEDLCFNLINNYQTGHCFVTSSLLVSKDRCKCKPGWGAIWFLLSYEVECACCIANSCNYFSFLWCYIKL